MDFHVNILFVGGVHSDNLNSTTAEDTRTLRKNSKISTNISLTFSVSLTS